MKRRYTQRRAPRGRYTSPRDGWANTCYLTIMLTLGIMIGYSIVFGN